MTTEGSRWRFSFDDGRAAACVARDLSGEDDVVLCVVRLVLLVLADEASSPVELVEPLLWYLYLLIFR